MMDVRRATGADGRLRVNFDGLKSWHGILSGRTGAGIPAMMAAQRFPRIELVLKRAIPVLIMAFLAVVAASHFLGMLMEHSRMETASRHATSLSLAAASAAFSNNAELFRRGDRGGAEGKLSTFLPQDRLDNDAF